MMHEAQQHIDAGRFAEAESIYRSLLEQEPGNAEAAYMLALARQQQGDLEESVSLMRRAVALEPDNAQVHFSLGTLLMTAKAGDEARESYLRALQIDPFHVGAHNGLAYAELTAGKYSAAENAANLALTEEPKNVQALVYLGTAKLEQKEFDKAIAYLQEALKERPDHQAAQVQLGRAFLAAGNAAFAMQCFENAANAQPDSGLVWDYLGTAQYANKMFAEAAQSFERALSLGRTVPEVFRGLAESQRALGFTEQAERTLKMASQPAVSDAELALLRAELMIARGLPQNALALLGSFKGFGIDLLRARAYEQMREFSQALQALKPHVDSGEAGNATRLEYARLLAKSGRDDEADAIVDEMLVGGNAPPLARVYKGTRLLAQDDVAGIEVLQQVEQEAGLEDVDRRRVRKILANALDREGRFSEATPYFEALSGRLSQAYTVAGGVATANHELRSAGKLPTAAQRASAADLPVDPVFLLAWPGSGWEWLAAGLGAHSAVKLVADKPATQAQRRALISEPTGREALQALTPEQAERGVRRYWNDLKTGGLEPGKRTTLDTLWLSADMLPTLATLFPASKVLVLNREPAAMVLEWFRAGYAELEGMASMYRDQRAGLAAYREWLGLEFIDVDGERLVQDPGRELRSVVSALGLEWEDGVGNRVAELAAAMIPPRGSWQDYRKVLAAPLAALAAQGEEAPGG